MSDLSSSQLLFHVYTKTCSLALIATILHAHTLQQIINVIASTLQVCVCVKTNVSKMASGILKTSKSCCSDLILRPLPLRSLSSLRFGLLE